MYSSDDGEILEILEYDDYVGGIWLEVFPYVFVPVALDGKPDWADKRLIDPKNMRFSLTATGNQSGYRVTLEEFENAIGFLVDQLGIQNQDEFANKDGSWNRPKVLAHAALRTSRDPFGARWIDRFKWIDIVSIYIIEENRDRYRSADFEVNLNRLRDVNWLSAVIAANESTMYRELKDSDFSNWEIDLRSVELARAIYVPLDEFPEFIESQCGNSLIRDLVAAHLLFDDAVDSNGALPLTELGVAVSRGEYRSKFYDALNPNQVTDFWSIRRMLFLPDVLDELRELREHVPTNFNEERAQAAMSMLLEIFSEGLDDYDEFTSTEWELTDSLIAFIKLHPEFFPKANVSPIWDYLCQPDGLSPQRKRSATLRAEYVFDVVEFSTFPPTKSVVQLPGLGGGPGGFHEVGDKALAMLLLTVLGFAWRNLMSQSSEWSFTRPDVGGFSEFEKMLKSAYGTMFFRNNEGVEMKEGLHRTDAYKEYRVVVSFETLIKAETQEEAERMARKAASDFLPLSGGTAFDEDYSAFPRPTFGIGNVASEEN